MKEIKIKSSVTLTGTLTRPEKNDQHIAIVMIPGSGKVDRNGNADKKGMDFNIYQELSDILVSLGYTTLRYDKRGVGKSEGDFLRTGLHDAIEDVQAAVQYIKNDLPIIDKVLLLGHSEGTMIATAVATQVDVGGVILLAGGGETLEEATKRQRELTFQELKEKKNFTGWLFRRFRLAEKAEKKNQRLFNKIKKSDKEVIRVQLIPFPAKWLREHFTYDLIADLKQLTCPVLAITGKADYQSDYQKLERVAELISSDTECHTIETMDHMLKEETDEVNMLEIQKVYQKNRNKPLHPEMKEILENWLQNN